MSVFPVESFPLREDAECESQASGNPGASFLAHLSTSAIGCEAFGLRPAGLRLRETQGGELHLMVGGSSPPVLFRERES